jgi:hypothetical protein
MSFNCKGLSLFLHTLGLGQLLFSYSLVTLLNTIKKEKERKNHISANFFAFGGKKFAYDREKRRPRPNPCL